MKVKIFHNARCSKSRQTLQLLQDRGIAPSVVEYLKTPPNEQELKQILTLLGLKPRQLMRVNEAEYTANGLQDNALSDEALIEAMVAHPILIERPIVVIDDKKAAIGRPPENILDIL